MEPTQGDEAEPMDVEPSVENLRPIAILIDSLAKDDMQIRISALKQVTRIADALGHERTRTELIPYLSDMLDDDDEVLRIICEVLISLMDYVGGNSFMHVLIPPYETLCVVEENSIRDLAITKLSIIVDQIPDDVVLNHVPPLFHRLFSSGWHTARTAAAGIAHHIYPRLVGSEHCQTLTTNFLKLGQDSMPQVRRAVAENMAQFASKMVPKEAESHVFPVLANLASDEQDSVRVRALEALVETGHLLQDEGNVKKLRSLISQLCKDPSWRVRFFAASRFGQICDRLESPENSLLDLFSKLLKDAEAEVRASASTQLPELAKYISEDVMNAKFVSTFKELSSDENKYTRAQFAEVLVPVGARYSKPFIMNNILPLVLLLLKDPEPEPRLKCLSHLDLDVLDPKSLLEAIMPCLERLAKDSSWRIRQSVMELLPSLSTRLGPDIVEKELNPLIFNLMNDQVQVVRQQAATTILEICRKLNNPSWSQQRLKEIKEKCSKWNYLRKQSALDGMKEMLDILPVDEVLEMLLSFCDDTVPNVRFKVCVITKELVEEDKIPRNLLVTVIEKILKMTVDSDSDVSYFATRAMEVFQLKHPAEAVQAANNSTNVSAS